MARLINTRTSRYYVTDDDGKRSIVHPGAVFEGSDDDAKADGLISANSKQGKAYLDARGQGADADDLVLSPDEADAEARENADDRDDDEPTDKLLEASQGTDLVSRALATSKIRNPHADADDALDEAVELAEADIGDGPVGAADIDPETGENRDNLDEPGEAPTHAADGRPIVEGAERVDGIGSAVDGDHELNPEPSDEPGHGGLPVVEGVEPVTVDGELGDREAALADALDPGSGAGTITATDHPDAMKGKLPATPDDADAPAASVEFTSDKAKAKAKSLKITQASLDAGKGSGAGGAYTVRDLENIAAERKG